MTSTKTDAEKKASARKVKIDRLRATAEKLYINMLNTEYMRSVQRNLTAEQMPSKEQQREIFLQIASGSIKQAFIFHEEFKRTGVGMYPKEE